MKKLLQWMSQRGITQADLAVKLGLTRSAVNTWATGKAYPSAGYAIAIEKITKGAVPWTSLISKHKRGAPR